MLWEPLALAALNQPPGAGGRAASSRACWPRCSDRIRGPRRSRCRPSPLHLMYAEPARAYIERARRHGAHRRGRDASASTATACVSGRSAAASAGRARAVIAAVPWFALARSVRRRRRRRSPPLLERAPADGVVADRHREPVVRSRRCSTSRSSVCPAARCSGCSTSAPCSASDASHLSLVSSGASPLVGAVERRADRDRARRAARGAAGRSRRQAAARDGRSRAARDVLARARASRRARRRETPVRGLLSRRRLDRHRAARYDRERGPQRPPGRRRCIRSR